MPPQQQPKGDEGSLDFLWMIVLIIVAILLIWYFGKSYIASAVLFIKLYEIYAIKFVLAFWAKLASFLPLPTPNLDKLNNWLNIIQKQTGAVSFDTLVKVNRDVGKFTRYPILLLLVLLAIRLYFGSISLQFKTIFDMKKLRDTEKVNWPRIMPVVSLDLVKKDINEGPWAMAMTPMQFCKKHKLLKEETKEGKPVVSLINGLTHQILALQLGPQWRGNINSLPAHIQALLAIFVARIDGSIEASDKLLDQISFSAAAGKADFTGTKELLKKHINAKPVVKVLSRHAYVMTMMASMLDLARGAGVLASADFLWLKPMDRKLWYVLNSVGRQTAMTEVAGIFAHWLVENKFAGPMKTPMVDTAVNGLEEAIADVLYEPEEE